MCHTLCYIPDTPTAKARGVLNYLLKISSTLESIQDCFISLRLLLSSIPLNTLAIALGSCLNLRFLQSVF